MAINKKSPSPEIIKKSTHSFENSELTQLKELRKKSEELTFNLGQLMINKIRIETTETNLKQSLFELEKEESILAKKLTSKYGKGSIDLESGTFTPIK
tara:strand:- start:756 stop:1049 length:294 start_codon:yes stop_codon:yes gene_type:complete